MPGGYHQLRDGEWCVGDFSGARLRSPPFPHGQAFVVVGDFNGHVGLGVKCAKEVATAIRGAIISAKLNVVPVRRGYWGNKIGKPHTVPTKITGKVKPGPASVTVQRRWSRSATCSATWSLRACQLTDPALFPSLPQGGSVSLRLVPAPKGAGIVAASTPKKVLAMAGIHDVYTASQVRCPPSALPPPKPPPLTQHLRRQSPGRGGGTHP